MRDPSNPSDKEREHSRELGQFLYDSLFKPQGPPNPGQGFRATIPNPFPELRSDQKPPEIGQVEEQEEQEATFEDREGEAEVEGGDSTPEARHAEADSDEPENPDGTFSVKLTKEQRDLLYSVLEGRLAGEEKGDPGS